MANPAARAIFLPETNARLFLSVESNRVGSARRVVDTRTGKHTARAACAREAVKIFVASERGCRPKNLRKRSQADTDSCNGLFDTQTGLVAGVSRLSKKRAVWWLQNLTKPYRGGSPDI